MFNNLADLITGSSYITPQEFLIPIIWSLFIGFFFAFIYGISDRHSKSLMAALLLLPAVVCVVIMAVNGNIGAGVAVAGSFSLVRFRSAPGTAKEILALFTSMCAGLLCGMGLLLYASFFILIMSLVIFLICKTGFGEEDRLLRSLKITIPENLDYMGIFDDVFGKYTSHSKLLSASTAQMGSVFRLIYEIRLKDEAIEKEMLDMIRERNGNLDVSCGRQANTGRAETVL